MAKKANGFNKTCMKSSLSPASGILQMFSECFLNVGSF